MNKNRQSVVDALINDLKARESVGIRRYGSPINAGDNYQYPWLLMKFEEDLDAIIYFLAHLEEEYPTELAAWRERQKTAE